MVVFDLLKKKRIAAAAEDALADASKEVTDKMVNAPVPKLMANEEYQKMRLLEQEWFENHYDMDSLDGIKRIPSKKGLRCPETSGVTGQLYYYLRHKAYEHEKDGNMDLAVACMSKSSELAMLDYGNMIQKQELYPLVKILARNGQIKEAVCEKEFVDQYCQEQRDILGKERFFQAIESAKQLRTDLVIMSVHGVTCSECAKYQGRVYSISGKSKKYPVLPHFFFETGRIHAGCTHSFYAFVDGASNPMMEHILSCHPLKNKSYGRNIVAFSNRPFEDDRTEAAKLEASSYQAKRAERYAQEQSNESHMIEYEAKRGQEARDYLWLKENIPDKCPKSVTGYRRMKTQNTKNFQVLKQFASEHGKKI